MQACLYLGYNVFDFSQVENNEKKMAKKPLQQVAAEFEQSVPRAEANEVSMPNNGNTAIVPDSFVKNFRKEEKIDPNEVHEVFWSANGEETPTSLLEKQGKILTIDKALETKRKRLSSPLPGYYFANILMIADSELELEMFLGSKSGRKGIPNNDKDVEKKEQRKKEKKADVVKNGKKRSLDIIFKKSKFPKLDLSDSDSDDSVIPIKIHK
ncbi:hypothetical protein JTE90_015745, partial [Oedothorax gibbosus]